MKKIRVEDAVGQTLCHDITAIFADGQKGARFKRGHVITKEDVPVMLDIGKYHVFVWEPGVDEVHEDDCAIALTTAISGDNIVFQGPSEGKMSLSAAIDGMFLVNREALRAINAVDDFTVACIPNHQKVKAGDQLAGARIVPLVTKRRNLEKALGIARENFPVFSVLPFKPLKCGIIITGSEVYYGRIEDRFEPVMKSKLAAYGADILGFVKCPDDLSVISGAIKDFMDKDADLIFLTGGMSVDPDDLTPTSIRESGAKVVTQGVPMQPGNMLMMAYLGKTMLLGVPGASMHFPITSLDTFLPRIFAGIEIKKEDIAGLGEGGLCMCCKVCHYPTCYFGRG
ncbi:MAG: molybdopterin-binding protein [Clostridiales bacterium]|nr:molybdopterin-binding protein [Clostridiales bacterium]